MSLAQWSSVLLFLGACCFMGGASIGLWLALR